MGKLIGSWSGSRSRAHPAPASSSAAGASAGGRRTGLSSARSRLGSRPGPRSWYPCGAAHGSWTGWITWRSTWRKCSLPPDPPRASDDAAGWAIAALLTIAVLGAGWFGIFLWKFMGSLPSVLRMGFRVLLSAVRPEPQTEGRQPETPPIDPVAAGLKAITDRDPAFTAAPFVEWTRQVSALLVMAWAEYDLQPCRQVLTEDCYQFEEDHIGRHLGEGWRLSAGSVTAGERQIVAAGTDD